MIRKKRIEKNLTQNQLARRLNVSRSYISKLENKSFNNPSLNFLKKLATILGLELDDLLDWTL